MGNGTLINPTRRILRNYRNLQLSELQANMRNRQQAVNNRTKPATGSLLQQRQELFKAMQSAGSGGITDAMRNQARALGVTDSGFNAALGKLPPSAPPAAPAQPAAGTGQTVPTPPAKPASPLANLTDVPKTDPQGRIDAVGDGSTTDGKFTGKPPVPAASAPAPPPAASSPSPDRHPPQPIAFAVCSSINRIG